jgi:membrane associated rhomboid family serine protease
MAGEVWRLVTPVFLHFGYMHLIFNMVWLWELGGVIENTKGPFQLLLMSIVIGVGSNVTQYVIDGPYFGGMSGVVFGFLCFLWVQGKFNRHFDMHVRNTTIVWMLGWYVICWTGLVGSIANWAHTGGLVLGCVWAVIAVTIDRFASRHEPVV